MHSWCKVCFRGYSNELNKSPIRQRVRRSYHLKYLYGISPDKYSDMFEQQGGRCAICKEEESLTYKDGTKHLLVVDHCHGTGKVRGLLCRNCNVALGLLKESKEVVEEALNYLNNFDNLEQVKQRGARDGKAQKENAA